MNRRAFVTKAAQAAYPASAGFAGAARGFIPVRSTATACAAPRPPINRRMWDSLADFRSLGDFGSLHSRCVAG
ncbi:MAG: hypothetical protein Fur0016_30930 [Anaerolineales bacterium]